MQSVVSQMVIKCNNNAISSSIDEYTSHCMYKTQALRRVGESFREDHFPHSYQTHLESSLNAVSEATRLVTAEQGT